MPGITVVHTRHVRRHAETAIFDRLGRAAPEAILEVRRDPDHHETVILHVNSGGNALACEAALRRAGYRVQRASIRLGTPDSYGVQLRVLPAVRRGVTVDGDDHPPYYVDDPAVDRNAHLLSMELDPVASADAGRDLHIGVCSCGQMTPTPPWDDYAIFEVYDQHMCAVQHAIHNACAAQETP